MLYFGLMFAQTMQVKELIISVLNGINITHYYDQKEMTGASSQSADLLNVH